MELFKVSDYESSVQYVTEGGMVVRATYSEEDQLTLSDIQVEAVDVYLDDDKFEDHIEKKVSNFIHSLYENDFGETETNFKEILDGWNDRIRFDQTNKRLHEKINKFSDQTNIVTTPEFTRFLEIAPQLLSFLKENISLKISQAQWAVLHQNQLIYLENLAMIKRWVNQYFNKNLTQLFSINQQLTTLQTRNVNPKMPAVLSSLTAIEKMLKINVQKTFNKQPTSNLTPKQQSVEPQNKKTPSKSKKPPVSTPTPPASVEI